MAFYTTKQNIMIKPLWHLMVTFVLSIVSYTIIISINMLFEHRIPTITGDASYLSNLGIILWCVAATVCIFSSVLLRTNSMRKESQFLLYSGLLTSYLLLDDFLQWHEQLFPKYLHIDEKVVYVILGVAALTLIVKFKKIILQTNYIVMLMGLFFLAISIAGDGILNPMEIVYAVLAAAFFFAVYLFISNRTLLKEYLLIIIVMAIGLGTSFYILQTDAEAAEYIFEEGAKWLGIAGWCSYYTYTAYQAIRNLYKLN